MAVTSEDDPLPRETPPPSPVGHSDAPVRPHLAFDRMLTRGGFDSVLAVLRRDARSRAYVQDVLHARPCQTLARTDEIGERCGALVTSHEWRADYRAYCLERYRAVDNAYTARVQSHCFECGFKKPGHSDDCRNLFFQPRRFTRRGNIEESGIVRTRSGSGGSVGHSDAPGAGWVQVFRGERGQPTVEVDAFTVRDDAQMDALRYAASSVASAGAFRHFAEAIQSLQQAFAQMAREIRPALDALLQIAEIGRRHAQALKAMLADAPCAWVEDKEEWQGEEQELRSPSRISLCASPDSGRKWARGPPVTGSATKQERLLR